MKKIFNVTVVLLMAALFLTSCERVAPNYAGVLMENYGKSGKSDFSVVKGRVNTAFSAGTELFQVPMWEQRAGFEGPLHLKAADNTEITAQPTYSFKIIPGREIDVVFDNKQLGSSDSFMTALEDNILEMKIRDIIKEESRKYTTDSLMANSGSLKFERDVEALVTHEFALKGLKLESFSAQLDFSDKVKEKIDSRNEVNTNVSVIDQQIIEQRKQNELEALKTEQKQIRSKGITPELLQQEALEKWDGKLPTTMSGNASTVMNIPIK